MSKMYDVGMYDVGIISRYSNVEMQAFYSEDFILKSIEDEIIGCTGFEPFTHSVISKMGVI